MTATIEDVREYGHEGDNVEELCIGIVLNRDPYYYVCPSCGESCYTEDGQIEIDE